MGCLIVAEIGINHNGDVSIAKQMMEEARDAGCDFVKFQKRTIDVVYAKEELDKLRESPFGNTNRDQKIGLEFEDHEYSILNECNHLWFASPWDIKSVDFLMKYGPSFMKVPSALITNLELCEYARKNCNFLN